MKRRFTFLIIILCGLFFNVNATEYKTSTLIPIKDVATIKTSYFDYNDISYGNVDSNGYTLFNFSSITNNSGSKKPVYVSIDILLFDENKKNIGYVTYCSKSDLDSNYTGYTLKRDESSPYSIQLLKKYFIDGKGVQDIQYYSILDDNKDCRNGGYNKYAGLTLEEITTNKLSDDYKPIDNNPFSKLNLPDEFNISPKIIAVATSITFLVIITLFFVVGFILNLLYKKMFFDGTFLAYLPITNIYITIKLAFGKIIASIYIILFLCSMYLFYRGLTLLMIILLFVFIFAFLLDIVKLITKKYNLLYFDPEKGDINSFKGFNKKVVNDDNTSISVNRDTSLLNNNNTSLIDVNDKPLNLNYGNNDNRTNENNTNAENNKDNDSDLSKMFR